MKWNSASVVSLLTGVIAMTGGSARAAAAASCAPVAVAIDASLQQRWPDLPAQIREIFQTRTDVDACAHIELAAAGAMIGVTVILPDGRTAFRAVARREDVLPALEALLLLPDAPAREDSRGEAPAPAAPAEATLSRADAPSVLRVAAPPPPRDQPAPFRIEIDVEAEARTGPGWVAAGAGVGSIVDLSHWLIGFQGRADRYQARDTGAQTTALELIALAGRRFRLGSSRTLDLTGGPALALHGTTVMVVQMTSAGVTMSQTDAALGVPRLVFSSRLTFGAQSLLRTFVEVDADVGPGTTTAPRPDEGGLPAWTVGLAMGAALGTR